MNVMKKKRESEREMKKGKWVMLGREGGMQAYIREEETLVGAEMPYHTRFGTNDVSLCIPR